MNDDLLKLRFPDGLRTVPTALQKLAEEQPSLWEHAYRRRRWSNEHYDFNGKCERARQWIREFARPHPKRWCGMHSYRIKHIIENYDSKARSCNTMAEYMHNDSVIDAFILENYEFRTDFKYINYDFKCEISVGGFAADDHRLQHASPKRRGKGFAGWVW